VWKALIADDEPKIRRGLRSLLERIDGEITVVAEAEDGQEAFEQAQAQLPDILFLDIRMPFLNGLELIEKLDQTSCDWLVIIITGHDEFDYARRAVSLKVFEYLLKPVDEEELRRTLERAKNELTLRRETNRYVVWAREQLRANKEVFQERFITDWLKGTLSKSDIDEAQNFLSMNLFTIQTLVALRLEDRPTKNDNLRCGYRNIMTYTIKAVVKELFPPSFVVIIDSLDTVVALGDLNKKEVEKIIPAVENAIEDATHQRPLIVLLDTPNERNGDIKTVQDLYEEAQKELRLSDNSVSYQTALVFSRILAFLTLSTY
jgi:two-component system response regulator YesN